MNSFLGGFAPTFSAGMQVASLLPQKQPKTESSSGINWASDAQKSQLDKLKKYPTPGE